jgi:c-di-GMP-related signal transduction protein
MELPGATPAEDAATAAPVEPTAEPTASAVHRRPVLDLAGRAIGYTVVVDPDRPPDVDVDAVYLSLDLGNLVADRYAFLPATPAMLDGYLPDPVVPGRLVLVLPRGFADTPGAAGRAGALRGLGMSLALSDFDGSASQVALLSHLAFVVVDAGPSGPPLPALVHQAHQHNIRVLAANVATQGELDVCRAAGVDGLLDSPFGTFSHTPPVPPAARQDGPRGGARVLRAGEAQCLTIINLLQQPTTSPVDVAQVIETDPVLTLRVLHLVNSGVFALSHQVDTVRQAVVLLGPKEVSTLVTALALEAQPGAMDRLWFILARAMACEVLADDNAAYTVGMLSALAANLGVPAEAVLEKVGVSDVVGEAVAHEAGPLGPVLRAVRAHEHSDPDGVLAAGLDPVEVSRVYLTCLRDALEIARTVTREG